MEIHNRDYQDSTIPQHNKRDTIRVMEENTNRAIEEQSKKEQEPSALSILHGFRKEAEIKKKRYNRYFYSFILLLVLDAIILFASYMILHQASVSSIAMIGLFVLIALSGLSLKIAVDARRYQREIDTFYLELERKKPGNF